MNAANLEEYARYAKPVDEPARERWRHPMWEEWTDEQKVEYLTANGFSNLRKMSDGEWVGTIELLFTRAICTGMDYIQQYEYRWCFEDREACMRELARFDNLTHIPTRGSYVAHRYTAAPLVIEYDEFGHRRW